MKVALITEGTYPFVHGGVSVWCDRLIRELSDVEFRLYAIAAGPTVKPVWELPPNAVAFETIVLEPSPGRGFARYPRLARREFLDALDALLLEILRTDDGEGFLPALRAAYEAGLSLPLEVGVRSEEAFDLIRERWQHPVIGDRFAGLGPPSLLDVLEVSSSLARFLKPLGSAPEGDIAHTTANGLGALTALVGKWEWGMPILLTEHGVYLRERYLEHSRLSASWRAGAFQLVLFRHLNGAMLREVDLVAPVSRFNRRWEVRTGGDPHRIHTIHNGVDPASFPPQIGEPEVPTISWIGRIDPLKDLLTLIDAFAMVHHAVPNVRLRLFGPVPPGNEDYHRECRQAIARHGLNGSVTFEGHTDRVSLAHEAGHVIALSSVSEGFPFTVLEAMMSGRATVSTDVGGVPEAVGNGGLLVRPRDPQALAQALIRVLTDHDLRHRLGRAARERALSMFTLDRMTGLYRAVYEAALTGQSTIPGTRTGAPAPSVTRPIHEITHDVPGAAGGQP